MRSLGGRGGLRELVKRRMYKEEKGEKEREGLESRRL